MQKKTILLFILLFTFCTIFAQNASIEYIKNEGQWTNSFSYKATTNSTDIYLSKNGFCIAQADADNHDKVHGVRHGWRTSPQILKYHAYMVDFVNANQDVQIEGKKAQTHYYNYFFGNDPSHWKSNIHPNLAIDYNNLYKGIDAHIYSSAGNMKYDLIIHPYAKISDVQLRYTGLDKIKIVKNKLVLSTSLGDNTELEPYAYQYINDEKVIVPCKYVLQDSTISFTAADSYNPAYDLVIDPTLVFCTFTGSTADNWGYTATYDSLGNFYAGGICGYQVGSSFTGNYPVTPGAFQTTFAGGGPSGMGNVFRYDASISKFNATGTTLLYATYLGGADNDQPHSMIVDHAGNLVIAGRTYSSDFPTSTGCYDPSYNGGGDMFIAKFNSTGTALLASTFVGGSGTEAINVSADEATITAADLKHNYGDDARSEVIVDANDNIYVASNTTSSDFPTATPSQANLGGAQDGVAFALNVTCSTLLWSTYLGGNGNDAAYVLNINKTNPNEIFVAGGTKSSNFPTTAGTLHTTFQGGFADGFLVKYSTTAARTLLASTYIGTNNYDQVYGVQTDDSNRVYIMGQTQGAYPVVGTVYSNPNSSQFVSRLDDNLTSLSLSTVFGSGTTSAINISPNAFLVDMCGNVYISGWGGPVISSQPGDTYGMAVTANAIKSITDGSDFYFIVFSKNLQSLLYGSYFGQQGGSGNEHVDGGTSRFDPNGIIYQSMCAHCGGATYNGGVVFPTTPGVYSPLDQSPNCNLAALKISFNLLGPNANAVASPNTTGCVPLTVNFGNASTNAQSYIWDFGDGTPINSSTSPTHTYTSVGTFIAKLYAFNANGCNKTSDTTYLTIVVKNDTINPVFNFVKIDSCNPYTATFTNISTYNGGATNAGTAYSWNFGDGTTSTAAIPPLHSFPNSGSYVVSLTMTDTNACNSPKTISKTISYVANNISNSFTMPDTVCVPYTYTFTNIANGAITYNWNFGDGTTSTAQTPTHTYSTPGVYNVVYIIANPASCNKFDTATHTVHVQPTITSDFTFTKIDTCNPFKIAIQNTSVPETFYTNAASWTTYTWNFGDGTSYTGINPATHSFPTFGTYTITLTMKDSMSCNSPQITTKVVTFINNTIATNFTMPDSACLPFSWVFNNNSTNVNTYDWNFGDGQSSTSGLPSHTYTAVGTYTITLIVANPTTCNKKDTATQILTIYPTPVAAFNYAPNPPLPNRVVNFINQSTGATSYVWDFGDGQSSTDINPSHLYNVTADLNACLTAYNQYGCKDSVCKPLKVRVNNLVDVPTGFTPNGDGINDFIQVRGYGIKEMIFKIYNRWGEKVFETNNLTDKWDGTYKGKLQEVDAFAYYLFVTYTDNSTETKKGNITLIQ